LAVISGGAIGAICGGGSVTISGGGNLDVDALCVGGANSNLGTGDVLATISGGAIGAICGGGSITIGDGSVAIGGGGNLDADALCMSNDHSILGVGGLGMDDQCSSSGNGALGGGILRADDGVVLAMGGGILGMHSGGGPDRIAIHNLPTPGGFTIASLLLYTHKEWSFTLLPGYRSTSDLTHNQRSKMLLSLSESGWGAPLVGGTA
jgi:hypothetical protein